MCWISALRPCRVMAWNDRSLKVLGVQRYYLLTERAEQSVRDCSQLFLFNLRNEIYWTSDWHLTSHWYLFSGSNLYFWENYKMQDFLALWWVNFRPKSKVIMGYHVFFGSSHAHCSLYSAGLNIFHNYSRKGKGLCPTWSILHPQLDVRIFLYFYAFCFSRYSPFLTI